MCNVENIPPLWNAAGFVYGPATKWRHWAMFIHWGNKQRSPERCTSRNATSAEFLEVQIPPRVLVNGWDP